MNPVGPPRPSAVEGCYVRFEKIEVTHAVIQLVLAVLGNYNRYRAPQWMSLQPLPSNGTQIIKPFFTWRFSANHDKGLEF